MQTFLPLPSFEETAKVLDYRRLGKQRVEARQILSSIHNHDKWSYHPIVKMWVGYEEALKAYFNSISLEWIIRGYHHNIGFYNLYNYEMPYWFGREEFHASHRAALLFKNYEYYSQFGWLEKPEKNYVWYNGV